MRSFSQRDSVGNLTHPGRIPHEVAKPIPGGFARPRALDKTESNVEIFVAKWLPFLYFRRQGLIGAAVAALLMQLTIILWPIASFWAMSHATQAQETRKWYALYRRDF